MKAKEKAIQLVDKYIIHTNSDWDFIDIKDAKECAKIAVEEIINLLSFARDLNMLYRSELVVFWNEVLKEIDNL